MIVAVEDHEPTRFALVRLLASVGHQAVGFSTLQAASEFLGSTVPVLLILDGVLPDGDGIALLRRLRAAERMRQIPVIVYSALDDPARVKAAMDCGADEYVVKGSGWTALLAAIHRCVPNAASPSPPPPRLSRSTT